MSRHSRSAPTRLPLAPNVDGAAGKSAGVHQLCWEVQGRSGCRRVVLNDPESYVGRIEQLQGRESDWHPVSELTPASKEPLQPPMATLHIQGGRKEKIRPGDVLGALTADLGYTREQVGKINVNEWSTYIAVDRNIGQQVANRLSRIKGKNVKARLLED